ncbi:hypothetical protein GCM10010466_28960 [Planomonospora alba]|uniref:Uncharacterized protein n=1 Tax=Planomonospora alba TaxID=161354 RepID=A0ABP6N5X3_9ACTN
MRERVRRTRWWSPGSPLVQETRILDVEPAEAADRAAWKRAGSPRRCRGGAPCRKGLPGPGTTDYTSLAGNAMSPLFGFSGTELLELPADPARLRSEPLRLRAAERDRQAKSGGSAKNMPAEDEWLWQRGALLLGELPTPRRSARPSTACRRTSRGPGSSPAGER